MRLACQNARRRRRLGHMPSMDGVGTHRLCTPHTVPQLSCAAGRYPGLMDDAHVPDLPDELPPLPPGVAHIDVAAMTHWEAMALSRRSGEAPCGALLPRGRMPGIPADREAHVTGARARRRIPCPA